MFNNCITAHCSHCPSQTPADRPTFGPWLTSRVPSLSSSQTVCHALWWVRSPSECYTEHPFLPGLVKYMNSEPMRAMVWEGLSLVKRVMLGETNPADPKPGTIRGDFCTQVGGDIIHGSDSVDSAKEMCLLFKPEEPIG